MTKRLTIFYQNTRMIYLTYSENSDTSLSFKLKRQGNPKTLKISPIRFDPFL